MTEKSIDELFREYELKFNETCNDAPIYDEDDIFGTYRAYRKAMLMYRFEQAGEERDQAVKAFVAMYDALYPKKNVPERIYLWPEGKMPVSRDIDRSKIRFGQPERPYMYEVLLPENVTPKGAILCVAGGAQGRTVINEGFGVALELRKQGYQTFVIHNRVNSMDRDTMQQLNGIESGVDVSRALRYIRANAEKYRINPDNVAAAGFSNGGMTIENCIRYYSGKQTVRDHFPDYVPDELDEYYGAPDAFLCVYGPRWVGAEFDYTDVVYPPTFYAVGREDGALDNLNYVLFKQLEHKVPVEVHTFAGTPHGRAAYNLIWEKEDHKNFDMWVPLSDYFMQDVYNKKKGE